jgi:hypothetical protein
MIMYDIEVPEKRFVDVICGEFCLKPVMRHICLRGNRLDDVAMFCAPGAVWRDHGYVVPEIVKSFCKVPDNEFKTTIVRRWNWIYR